ncbi:DsrE family protein [Wohlfahrtiimonas larvae]|uniref:DsrE family protein n=1 Tax=Wohlfahrtiimonas larvae TaxID=1157986 RepID=A0ABP9MTC8_9GAMM|nr:DsrE family protein [Wohlfahrtiimonas larvae]
MNKIMNFEVFKVVFHVDEIDKWDRVIANVNNLLKEIDVSNAHIIVIANAQAVKGYLMPEKYHAFRNLVQQNVTLNICHNSMRGLDIQEHQLPDFVRIVSAAVMELVRKQHEGFAYIKP